MNAQNFKLLACIFCVFAFSFSMEAQVQTQDDAAKVQWIQQNPSDYIKMGGTQLKEPNFTTAEQKKKFEEERATDVRQFPQVVVFPSIPSFPKYTKTGNLEQDERNYRAAKDVWIQQNQELYQSLSKPTGETRENTPSEIKSPN